MAKHCADARFVWNLALEQANYYRPERGATPSRAERQKQLADARKCTWLSEGSSSVQQQALRDFDQAMRNWWCGSHRRPTWRRKGVDEGFEIRDVRVTTLSGRWAEVTVPKNGHVRFRLARPLPAKYGMARVTTDSSGRWHVSFSAPQAPVQRQETGATVGVDLGVVATITTSDGDQFLCPRLRPTETARLKRLQRRMSRQMKDSNRRARTKHAIAVLRAREADRRKDWVEKTSTWLVRTYDVVVFEDLKVRRMMASASRTVEKPGVNVAQKRGLNRSIAQQGWAMLIRRTEEKAGVSDVAFAKVDPHCTSQECSVCGLIDPASRRSQSVFRCTGCGHTANADINASLNIRARGLRVLAHGGSQWGVGEVRTLDGAT